MPTWGSRCQRGLPWPYLGTTVALLSLGTGAATVPLLALQGERMAQAPVGRCPRSPGQTDPRIPGLCQPYLHSLLPFLA